MDVALEQPRRKRLLAKWMLKEAPPKAVSNRSAGARRAGSMGGRRFTHPSICAKSAVDIESHDGRES